MFSKSQAVVFALSILSVSLGRPFDSETHVKRHKPAMVRAQVVRAQVIRAQVVPRDASASCTTCTRTVTVSGTATASAEFTVTASAAFTVTAVGSSPTSTASPTSIVNFGACSAPQIEFGAGFDNRTETSFRPVDQVSYNHDSADDITVIADFICSALVTTCGANPVAQAMCARAQSAAAAEIPQEGIDADVFNAVFGFFTNFKNVEALSNTGEPITGSTNSSAASPSLTAATSASTDVLSSTAVSNATTTPTVSTSSHNAATHDASATHLPPPPPPPPTTLITVVQTSAAPTEPAPTSAAGNSNSNNLQSFTGALGGISAPPVVASGNNQFQVEGVNSPFNTKADALSRSCSVQQNDCANAANLSKNQGSLTVAACHTQQSACNAANGA
ncbi:hypothetical protein MVEN_02099100 [Mycena venus]|uniref:Uncharacterized protein n=1 Tax=Mycena venus TaxID=2733690 RepID=A0A8H6X9V8_9AGAR|nr:hypothetical protein MVEN_02099100 [Mycena venus]